MSILTNVPHENMVELKKRKRQCELNFDTIIERSYEEVNGKKVQKDPSEVTQFRSQICVNINPFLDTKVWDMLELSNADVMKIFEQHDARELALFAIQELDMSLGAVIVRSFSYYASQGNDYNGRPTILKKLVEKYGKSLKSRSKYSNKLRSNEYIPSLPTLEWTDEECKQLKLACGSTIREDRSYPTTFLWKGFEWLPYDVQKKTKYIQLVRVMPKTYFLSRFGKPENDLNDPEIFKVNGVEYYDDWLMIVIYNNNKLHEMDKENWITV